MGGYLGFRFSSLLLSILSLLLLLTDFNTMKINSEQKCARRKSRNKRRSKKRRNLRRKLKYLKMHSSWTNHAPMPAVFSGECYWKNYNSAIIWQRNYINCCNLSSGTSVDAPTYTLETGDSESTVNTSFPSNSTDNYQSDYSEEEGDYGVSEEWIAFLEENKKHKEALRLEREAKNEKELIQQKIDKETKKVCERDDIEDCRAPNERTVDGSRIVEMTELYGKDSPKILGMETAIQLTFNKNCDYYKPPYWPCLPLRLKFTT